MVETFRPVGSGVRAGGLVEGAIAEPRNSRHLSGAEPSVGRVVGGVDEVGAVVVRSDLHAGQQAAGRLVQLLDLGHHVAQGRQ